MQLTNEDLQKLVNHFEAFDKDGDGILSKEDIMQGFLESGHEFSDEEFEEMIKEVDRDVDGKIGLEEFVEGFLKEKFKR